MVLPLGSKLGANQEEPGGGEPSSAPPDLFPPGPVLGFMPPSNPEEAERTQQDYPALSLVTVFPPADVQATRTTQRPVQCFLPTWKSCMRRGFPMMVR